MKHLRRHRYVIPANAGIQLAAPTCVFRFMAAKKTAAMPGMTVPIIGHDTQGVAVCNQVRTFDIEARGEGGDCSLCGKT